jgi:hypothetical protein
MSGPVDGAVRPEARAGRSDCVVIGEQPLGGPAVPVDKSVVGHDRFARPATPAQAPSRSRGARVGPLRGRCRSPGARYRPAPTALGGLQTRPRVPRGPGDPLPTMRRGRGDVEIGRGRSQRRPHSIRRISATIPATPSLNLSPPMSDPPSESQSSLTEASAGEQTFTVSR